MQTGDLWLLNHVDGKRFQEGIVLGDTLKWLWEGCDQRDHLRHRDLLLTQPEEWL